MSHRASVIGHRSMIMGHWSFSWVMGHRLLVMAHRSSVIGHAWVMGLSIFGYRPLTFKKRLTTILSYPFSGAQRKIFTSLRKFWSSLNSLPKHKPSNVANFGETEICKSHINHPSSKCPTAKTNHTKDQSPGTELLETLKIQNLHAQF